MDFTKIQQPSDVKKLSETDLNELVQFCRKMILRRTSVYGGHVGPDLGINEGNDPGLA